MTPTRINATVAPFAMAGLLAAITIAAYIPALRAGYIWDDDAYLTANRNISEPGGLARSWFEARSNPQYYPLVFSTFWVEYRLWGLNPTGYHVTNILLHAANAVLVYLVLRRLGLPGAWIAAAIFAVHPVCVESVAWITERKNVLSTLFYLFSLLAYLKFAPLDAAAGEKHKWGWYAAALAFFAAALFSKTITCSLPAAILLLIWWKRGRIRTVDVVPLLPMFAFGLGMAFVTSWIERHHVGTQVISLGLTPASRVVLAGQATWFYLWKLVWPGTLIFIYPKWTVDPARVLQWIPSVGLLGLLTALFVLRKHIGRGPLVAALLYVGTLVPALGFIDVFPMRYSWVADHFQYLASIAPMAAAASALVLLRSKQSWLPSAAGTAVVAILGTLTFVQCGIYSSAATVWRDTLKKNPGAWMALNNLANELIKQGNIAQARTHLEQAIVLNPRDGMAYRLLAQADLAAAMAISGERHANQALEYGTDDKAEALSLRGLARMMQSRPGEALVDYDAALAVNPKHINALMNKAQLLISTGRQADACAPLLAAIERSPDMVEARMMLAEAYLALGRPADAASQCREVLKRKPDTPNVRWLLSRAEAATSAPAR